MGLTPLARQEDGRPSQRGAVRLGGAPNGLGTPRATGAHMGDTRRELLALQTIVVSGRAALLKTASPEGRRRVRDRITELLAELEERVRRDGANPEVLARLDAARRDNRE